jgi:hypothetical protein
MAIKAVIIDISGTMLNKINQKHTIVENIPEMVLALKNRNIEVFVASNDFATAYSTWEQRNILHIDKMDNILHKDLVDGKKGSKKFVGYVRSKLDLEANEILYLGDTQFDCYEAVNSNVAFFSAMWSNPKLIYGIPVQRPLDFINLLDTFFLKNNLWYYRVDDIDLLKRQVIVRSLLDPDKATTSGIKNLLKSKGERGPKTIKGYPSGWYLSMHLFASVYLEGLHISAGGRNAIWCLYPGHDGPHNSILTDFVTMISRAFNQKNSELIQRHTRAIHSSSSRYRGMGVAIDNQFQTIQLNPAFDTIIKGKTVIVVDDFTTEAYSFETARNFIFNANAKSVICIAVGKYHKPYFAYCAKDNTTWDSFVPATELTQGNFTISRLQSSFDTQALNFF